MGADEVQGVWIVYVTKISRTLRIDLLKIIGVFWHHFFVFRLSRGVWGTEDKK